MDKKYYHLDADRTAPKGPHTLHELSAMLLSGEVTPSTEIAAVGDKHWYPLGTVLMQSGDSSAPSLPPFPAAAGRPYLPPMPQAPGACPGCGKELSTGADGKLPATCPECHFRLAPEQDGMWQHILLGLSRPFMLRGRSTRMEYWSTTLFAMLIMLPVFVVTIFIFGTCTALSLTPDSHGLASWLTAPQMLPAWIMLGICALVWLWFICVFIGLSVRRLHDIGRGGWWYLLMWLFSIGWQIYYYTHAAAVIASVNWQLIFAIEDAPSRNARLNEITEQINTAGYDSVGIPLYLAQMALAITVFVFSLMDSSRGANKYGPSVKYPHG